MEMEATHSIGEGFVALPEAERHSGRWGTVCLIDADGIPLPLHGIEVGRAAALTVIPLPDTDNILLPIKRELLGTGALFTESVGLKGREAIGVGVRPVNGRLIDWLFPSAVSRLLDRRVRLEAHLAWPACTCGILATPGDPARRGTV